MARRATLAAAHLAGALLALLAACGDAAPEGASALSFEVLVSPAPPSVGAAQLSIALRDAQGAAVEGASVRVEATMSHAGMQPEFAEASEVAPGRYEAALEFTMGGDWILLLDATTPDGRVHRAQREVPGVSAKRAGGG